MSLIGLLCLCSCGNNKGEKEDTQEVTITNDIITVMPTSPILKKIQIQTIDEGTYRPQFSTSGVVKAIPSNYAEISTPFAGRIVKSFIKLGETVSKGSPLFELSSPTFYETTKTYFEAVQEMKQSYKIMKRQKDLLANSVGIKKEVEEAEMNYQLKRQDLENAVSALKVFQVNPNKIKLGEPLIVRSPIAGKVVDDNIVLGQYLKEDAAPLAVVANLNKVWVMAHVKEKDLSMIEKLNDVQVILSAKPDAPIKGEIYHISEILDESTRAVEVIILCDNKQGDMRPNMYGTVLLTDSPINGILIPTTAILQEEDKNYVLTSIGKDKFKKVSIVAGDVVGSKTVVKSGLNIGDKIISEGAFYLLDAK